MEYCTDVLLEAQNLSRAGVTAALRAVTTSKAQTVSVRNRIVLVRRIKDEKRKFGAFNLVAKSYSKTIDEAVIATAEAETAIHKALDKLTEVQILLAQCMHSIACARDQLQNECDAALASANRSYGWAALGLLGGLFWLLISCSITAGITEGLTRPAVLEKFSKAVKRFEGYETDFKEQYSNTSRVKTSLEASQKQLIDVESQLVVVKNDTAFALDAEDMEEMEVILHALGESQYVLLKVCDTFLAGPAKSRLYPHETAAPRCENCSFLGHHKLGGFQ